MIGYLLGILVFLLYAYWTIQTYYVQYSHLESATAFGGYLAMALLAWAGYKAWTTMGAARAKDGSVQVPRWVVPAALALQLALGSVSFLGTSDLGSYAPALFLKILGWSALPALVAFVVHGLGKRLVAWAVPERSDAHWQVWTLLATGAGWGVFLAAWAVLGALGLFSGWTFFLLLAAMAAFGWRESLGALAWWGGSWRHEPRAVARNLTSEWFFAVVSFTFVSNFVNVVRPLPIGWDDLGVYMNFPKLMAQAGGFWDGAGMLAWQSFTSAGFLLGSPTQAFFLSCLGGVLGVMACWLAVSHALRGKRGFVDVALLCATTLYVMPMVVFQQAKDMKLDMGLLAVTVGAVYPLAVLLLSEVRSGRWKGFLGLSGALPDGAAGAPRAWRPYALVGLALGTAFAIKVTTLMTFWGAFALVAMVAGGWAAFLGWNVLLAGIFTVAGLWGFMNVPVPAGGASFQAGLAMLAVAAVLLGWSAWRHAKSWKGGALAACVALAAGAALALSPWLAKNLSETVRHGQPITVGTLLSGYASSRFQPDLSAVYSAQELADKKAAEEASKKAVAGQTSDEDLGRYIGYEVGLNNYAKLPWNMTMQANQRGEFTDITYLYLALVPGSFLFLAYRRRWMVGAVILAAFGAWVLFAWQPSYFVPGVAGAPLVEKYPSLFVQDAPESSPNPWRSSALLPDDATWAERVLDPVQSLLRPVVAALTPAAWRGSYYDLPLASMATGSVTLADAMGKLSSDAAAYARGAARPEAPAGWSAHDAATYATIVDRLAAVSFAPGASLASLRSDAKFAADRDALVALRLGHRSWNQRLTDALSVVGLPAGYAWLALAALALLAFLWFATSAADGSYAELRAHAAFAAPYVLLYAVAAFAIPWYGIMMYVSMLLVAAFGLAEMSRDDGEAAPSWHRSCRGVGALVLVLAASAYFVDSSLPHAASNLRAAGWTDYKLGRTTVAEETLSPSSRPGYLEVLSTLNLKDSVRPLADLAVRYAASRRADEQYLAKILASNGAQKFGPADAVRFLTSARAQLRADDRYALYAPAADRALQEVMKGILYPAADVRNEGKIFRLGTFMTYHVSQNVTRFYEDNLLTWFDRYVADADPDVAAGRLKKLGFSYMLADLNAATIDRDPRHDLTRRYEELLWSFYSKKLDLAYTDNLCIRVARDVPGLTKDQFVAMAGTNYESYDASGAVIRREAKQANCRGFVADLLASGKAAQVPSLAGLAKSWAGVTDKAQLEEKLKAYVGPATWMALFTVK